MWRRISCIRSQPFVVHKAWKSTRRSTKTHRRSSLFEDNPLPELPPTHRPLARLSQPTIPIQTRIVTILVAFAAGFSIIFFLDDPEDVGPPPTPPMISPTQYTMTKLTSTEPSGPDTKLLKIAAPPHLLPLKDADDASIWSIFIKDDDIQVERAYTPLNGVDTNGEMSFWVKKYPKGEVGRWLHSKNAGDRIEVRGPVKTWPWKQGVWDEVVMISGGTGITPFVQLFNNVISKSPSPANTRFTLLHSSRTPGELPPAAILAPMVEFSTIHPDIFRLHVFVDEVNESRPPIPLEHIKTGRINEVALKCCLTGPEEQSKSWWWRKSSDNSREQARPRIMFLVCGPDPMVGSIAGPFGRNFSQGTVGGILKAMGYASNEVYKL